jgi:hypothetical protein
VRNSAILLIAVIPALAQTPAVKLTNSSRPAADFQIGDRYEISIKGAAAQPVSLRISRQGRTDWGPVIGWTDAGGRWLATGQFDKSDFGGWREVWTVGGRRAESALEFRVDAPCRKGGQGQMSVMGPNMALTCETAAGVQTFVTPSDPDPFRTPDGRVIPGRSAAPQTREQYQAEILTELIMRHEPGRSGLLGDEAGDLILKTIGVNALDDVEIRNVVSIVRAAFEKPETIPQALKEPARTMLLLRKLEEFTDQEGTKQEIYQALVYVQAQARL